MSRTEPSSGKPSNGSRPDQNGHRPPPPPDVPPAELTEAEYLAQQSAAAKEAVSRVVGELRQRIAEGANPLEWCRAYPWATLGAAAVAAFAAAAMLIPSKEQQALRRLAAIERALNPDPPRRAAEPQDGVDHHARGGSFLGGLAKELIGAVKPAVVSLLSAHLGAKAAQPSPQDMREQAEAMAEGARQGTADADRAG